MAIYHFHVKVGSRAKGQSAAAKARYILRQGKFKKDKDEVLFSMSGNMPAWAAASPLKYWKAADDFERTNGVLFREMDLALPVELDLPQKIQLAKKIAAVAAEGQMAYTMGLHHGRGNNPHLHLMLSERINDGHRRTPEIWFKRAATSDKPPEAGGARKADIASRRRDWLAQIRARWAEMANEALASAGFSARIDHRTLAEQGENRLPQIHMGSNAVEMEQRGITTGRADRALAISEANQLIEELKEIDREISHECNRSSETVTQPAENRETASPAPASKPANRQAGKRDNGHGQDPEKAPATASPTTKGKPFRPTSWPMNPPQKGGPKMQGSNILAAGIASRKRQKAWEEHRFALLHSPAAGMTHGQAERRRELIERWDWLRHPEDVRRRAVEANRQGREALRQIEERRLQAHEAARHRESEIREIQERLESLRPLQIFEKSRLAAELQAAGKAMTEAMAEQKRLALAEQKLLQSCPSEVVERYQHSKEGEREKAVADFLEREAREREEERRREEVEAKARQERMAMRPTANKKPGGWTPPSPS